MAAIAPLSAGRIRLEIAVDPVTRAARRVTVRSTRPTGFSGRLLAGRSAGEVPALLARMHALCGRSHWVAAETAIIAPSCARLRTLRSAATASGRANCWPTTQDRKRPPRISPRASSRWYSRSNSRHGGNHDASRSRIRQQTTP